jgi:hypothetical protein
MTFATIYLDIDKDDAHEIIKQSVDGIRSERVNGSVEYRNTGGMLLAVLSSAQNRRGAKSKLRYETSVIASWLAHGRVKANEVKEAVESHRVPHM